jgi:acetoin utilization deacetylase AcuC-like enzyme
MKVAVLYSDIMAKHQNGIGHPERPERVRSLFRRLSNADFIEHLEFPEITPASRKQALYVHTEPYIDQLEKSAGPPVTFFDADTQANQYSYEAALTAAGAALTGVELTIAEPSTRSFALCRPPGHHAESNRAMGFCFINSVAVAAQHAIQELDLKRVAIVDWDVHHGNGTQEIFYERGDVFYASIHQFPHYPGTGGELERGAGEGQGTTLNVPLPAGSNGDDYRRVMAQRIIPSLEAFEPELLLVSAGFDAHVNDPLASMTLNADDYAELTHLLAGFADRVCEGRVVHVLEGGYDLDALGEGAEAVIRSLIETRD